MRRLTFSIACEIEKGGGARSGRYIVEATRSIGREENKQLKQQQQQQTKVGE